MTKGDGITVKIFVSANLAKNSLLCEVMRKGE